MTHLFLDMMHKGGGVLMWTIFFNSVVIWTLGIGKLVDLLGYERARKVFRRKVSSTSNDPRGTGRQEFDNLLTMMSSIKPSDHQRFTSVFREFLISTVPRLNRGFSSMTAWISVAPLLGLLGTVMGMIATFDIITHFGVGNPSLTAEGISVALLTTQAGLTVAFPGVIFQSLLLGRKSMILSRIMQDGEELLSLYRPSPNNHDVQKGVSNAV